MLIKIRKLSENAVIPQYAKNGDAAMDLTATSYEYKDDRHIYGTGLAVEIPSGYVGLVFPRSSICKYDLRLTNAVGVIDSGYRGEIKAVFENDNMMGRGFWEHEPPFRIYNNGDRIAQMIIIPYPEVTFEEVQDLSSTARGENGFGSSGK